MVAVCHSRSAAGEWVLAIQPQVFCHGFCYLCFFIRLIKVRMGDTQVGNSQQESLRCSPQADPLMQFIIFGSKENQAEG